MRVQVAKEHITNGVAKNSQHCMIADAIKAARPKALYIMVDLQTIRFTDPDKGKRYTYLTPAVAQSSLLKFDKGDKVTPFAFTLTSPVTRTSGWAGQRAAGAKRPKTPRKQTAARKRQFAYLKANRARNHQKERKFGLRAFVD